MLRSLCDLSPTERRQLLAIIGDIVPREKPDSPAVSPAGVESWIVDSIRGDASVADVKLSMSISQGGFLAAALQNAMACGLLDSGLLWTTTP